MMNAGMASDWTTLPNAGDGRPALAEIDSAFDVLREAGWREHVIVTQTGPSGAALPIRAFASAEEIAVILIGGIHGREPGGALALAACADQLAAWGRVCGFLVMPLLNPWGYRHHVRYGPSGQSVSDSDHLLGRQAEPACPEAAAITGFVMNDIRIRPGARVLDLHEDPVYEAPGYRFDGFGSYIYVAGPGAAVAPATRGVRECLVSSPLPLIREGETRFGERLTDGMIVDTADGSIDELLARHRGCSPVITVENLLHAPDSPPLALRIAVYRDVVSAFVEAVIQEPLCARRSSSANDVA
jgi:hypothetical protein